MRTIHRNIVGGYIFSSDGYILLGKTVKGGSYEGYHVIPGGGIDEGETKLEALKRELMEEVGLDISTAVVEAIQGVIAPAKQIPDIPTISPSQSTC